MFIIDRMEENWAVIEFNDITFNLPLEILPPGIKAGDVLNISITVDENATRKRREDIEKLARELFNN